MECLTIAPGFLPGDDRGRVALRLVAHALRRRLHLAREGDGECGYGRDHRTATTARRSAAGWTGLVQCHADRAVPHEIPAQHSSPGWSRDRRQVMAHAIWVKLRPRRASTSPQVLRPATAPRSWVRGACHRNLVGLPWRAPAGSGWGLPRYGFAGGKNPAMAARGTNIHCAGQARRAVSAAMLVELPYRAAAALPPVERFPAALPSIFS